MAFGDRQIVDPGAVAGNLLPLLVERLTRIDADRLGEPGGLIEIVDVERDAEMTLLALTAFEDLLLRFSELRGEAEISDRMLLC